MSDRVTYFKESWLGAINLVPSQDRANVALCLLHAAFGKGEPVVLEGEAEAVMAVFRHALKCYTDVKNMKRAVEKIDGSKLSILKNENDDVLKNENVPSRAGARVIDNIKNISSIREIKIEGGTGEGREVLKNENLKNENAEMSQWIPPFDRGMMELYAKQQGIETKYLDEFLDTLKTQNGGYINPSGQCVMVKKINFRTVLGCFWRQKQKRLSKDKKAQESLEYSEKGYDYDRV